MSIGVILNQDLPTPMLPQIIVTPIVPFSSVTASNGSITYEGTFNGSIWIIQVDDYGEYNITATKADGSGTSEDTVNVTVNQVYEIEMGAPTILPVLNDNSWEVISYASTHNLGQSYWSVGDRKQIRLNGTVGTVNFDNYATWVYIIGFNHNEAIEGQGITFGTFKTASNGGTDVALVDNAYSFNYTNGTKYFNMNHWGAYSYGGWKGCDLRYDVLGSTNQAPSGYGRVPTTNRTGYDATNTTATSPVSGTLMAALPGDLRVVMKPMTIYTDNKGGSSNTATNVTTSIDYLPLLAEFEIFGTRTYANPTEQSYQTQYQYYINGNSKVKDKYNVLNSSVNWQERSSSAVGTVNIFNNVNTNGTSFYQNASYSSGIAPIFRI